MKYDMHPRGPEHTARYVPRFLLAIALPVAAVGCAPTTAERPIATPDPTPVCAVTPAREASTTAFLDATKTTSDPVPSEGSLSAKVDTAIALSGSKDPSATTDTKIGAAPASYPDRRAVEALEAVARSFPVEHTKRGAVMTLASDDLFEPGSTVLTSPARWRLNELATALAAQSARDIFVRVYTDALGDRDESRALSQSRADSLRDYFVAGGVASEQIHAEGLGAAHPVADNATREGRAANRRVEIVIRAAKQESAASAPKSDHTLEARR